MDPRDNFPPEFSGIGTPHYGIVAKTLTDFGQLVPVILPDFDDNLMWGPCRWQSRDPYNLPVRGDQCLVVFDNSNNPWVIAWWPANVGGPGGGGGGGGNPRTNPNLYVQTIQPDQAILLLDTFWLPLNLDGSPRAVSFWQVNTGHGDGNGGNLFVQFDPPTAIVNYLWIPLNLDGTPKYLDEWVVNGTLGQQVNVGNPNLFIQTTLPVSPPQGSMYIPLNADGSAKSKDQWKVWA